MIFQLNQVFHQSFVVTDEVYNGFIQISQDRNPLHTSDDFAKEKGFSGKVMHGNILNAFLSYFIGECMPTKNVIIHSQQIQFKNPVYLGQQLAFKAEVSGVYDSVNAVEFSFSFKFSDKTVAKGKIQIGILK